MTVKHNVLTLRWRFAFAAFLFLLTAAAPVSADSASAAPLVGEVSFRLPVNWEVLPEDAARARQAWGLIDEASRGWAPYTNVLHVAYVTFADHPAQPDYRARYDRVLKHVQAYFADQMQANGFPPLTFPLNLDAEGRLVIYDVHVDRPMKGLLSHEAHALINAAVKTVLAEKGIDAGALHLLCICPNEGIADFVCAYVGVFSGRAWVCEQRDLDPLHFLNGDHYGGYYNATYGQNTSIYIGTLAHELGHVFSMHHAQEGWEYPHAGRSLMATGSMVYGNELRGEKPGAFILPANALEAAAHPLFTRRLPPRADAPLACRYEEAELTPLPDGAVISGVVRAATAARCYAVIARCDPPQEEKDYDATAAVAVPDADGRFALSLRRPGFRGFCVLTLEALFTDGRSDVKTFYAGITDEGLRCSRFEGSAYFADVEARWRRFEFAEAKAALDRVEARYGDRPAVRRGLPMWRRAVAMNHPVFLWRMPGEVDARERHASLVDCRPDAFITGFGGAPGWDAMIPSELGPVPYLTAGIPPRFIMVHAQASLAYTLNRRWKALRLRAGMPHGRKGTIRFRVRGDEHTLFTSRIIREGESIPMHIDVEDVATLIVEVLDADGDTTADWAILGDPVLTR